MVIPIQLFVTCLEFDHTYPNTKVHLLVFVLGQGCKLHFSTAHFTATD